MKILTRKSESMGFHLIEEKPWGQSDILVFDHRPGLGKEQGFDHIETAHLFNKMVALVKSKSQKTA